MVFLTSLSSGGILLGYFKPRKNRGTRSDHKSQIYFFVELSDIYYQVQNMS